MAYGIKYTSTFQQLKDYSTTEWQIKIYLEGYGGASAEFFTEMGSVQLRRDGDISAHILPTTLEFGLTNETEGQYKEFRDADWGDYMVELIKDPNGTPITYFRGYNQSEIYTEPFGDTGGGIYPSQLKFTCGLSHLKYVRWDNSGTLYTGQKALIEIIRLATNKLPTGLNVTEFVNVFESTTGATTVDSPLNQSFLDAELFKKMTKSEGNAHTESAYMCYEVLEQILKSFRCQMYISSDSWYIIRKQEYKDATMYYRIFNANVGTESTIGANSAGSWTTNTKSVTNVNNSITDIQLPAASAEKETIQPLNRAQITFQQQSLDFNNNNLLKNGDFEIAENADTTAPITYSGFPKFWTEGSGLDYTTYFAFTQTTNLYHPNGNGLYDRGYQFNPNTLTASTFAVNNYIQYEKLGVQVGTADTMELNFNFWTHIEGSELVNGGLQWVVDFLNEAAHLVFEIQIKVGTYYLGGDAVVGYTWSTVAGRAKLEMNGFDNSPDGGWFQEPFNITQILPNMPESGLRDIQFRIWQPYSDIATWSAASGVATAEIMALVIHNVELNYLPSGVEPVNTQTLYADINEDENYEEISVIIGDSTNSVSQGALKLASGLNTDVWNRRGITENVGILSILLKSMRDDLGGYGEMVNGTLFGEFLNYNTIDMTIGGVTSEYMIQGYTQMLETNEWNVSLFKLQTFVKTLTLSDSNIFNPPPTPTTLNPPIGNPNARIVATPTVTLANPTPILVNNQGNLNNY